MKVYDELTFYDISRTSWSGAVATIKRIEDEGKEEAFEALIDELYPEGIDRTELNDLLWFEDDWLYKQLNITEEDEGAH